MVVDNDAQPRPCWLPIIADRPEIELGVIGLPDLVRAFGLTAINQIIGVAISLRTFDPECFQVLGDGADDVVDSVVSRWILALLTGNTAHFPINRTRAERWPLQREAFSEMTELLRQTAALTLIRPSGTGQAGQSEAPITAHPVLSCTQRQCRLHGDARQRHVLLQVRTKRLVAIEGALSLPFGQFGQSRKG